MYIQARAGDFPQGGAREFFRPPLKNFRPPSGGGEIFPEGGEKKICVTLQRARFFLPPLSIFRPPLRGGQQNLRGGDKKKLILNRNKPN